MMNNRETVADVVAQMRGRGEDGRIDRRLWLDYADRIEAAWKRERAKVEADALEVGGIIEAARTAEKSSAVGNTAAMREALVNLDKWLFIGVDGYVHGQPDMTDEIERTIKSALSAPTRNCDMEYTDRVEMYSAFKDWCKAKGHTMEPMLAYDAFDWLLAPAKKEKGEGE